MHDFAAIADIAHEAGALAIGDGVSFHAHRVLDVSTSGSRSLPVQHLECTFGTRIGCHVGQVRPVLDTLKPQGHYFCRDLPHHRFSPAGAHAPGDRCAGRYPGIHRYDPVITFSMIRRGFFASAAKVFELFAEHVTVQANQVLAASHAIPGARIMGQDRAETGSRAATIAFTIDGMRCSEAVGRSCGESDCRKRNGHFHALRCLEPLGIQDSNDGIIRISLVHYNSSQDVDRLVEGLKEL